MADRGDDLDDERDESEYLDDYEFGLDTEDPPPPEPGPLEITLRSQDFLGVGIFIAAMVACSLWSWQDPHLRDLSVSRADVVGGVEWWRLVSAIFVHADLGHLIANVPLIAFFGMLLQKFFGWRAFPVMALFVGALTNLGTVYFYAPHQRLLGASGMLYGVVAMWLALYLRYEKRHNLAWRLVRVVAFVLIVLFPTVFRPEVSYLAHGLGFIFGAAAVGLSWPAWQPITRD